MGENLYVRLYKESRARNPQMHRDSTYQIAASVIAESGKMEDLKALNDYFNYESEVLENERFTTAI